MLHTENNPKHTWITVGDTTVIHKMFVAFEYKLN